MLQRRTILLHTHLRTKRSGFERTAEMYDRITSESIIHVTEHIAKGEVDCSNNEDDNHVHRLMQDVHLINANVAGSSSSRLQMRNEIRALMTVIGVPAFFVTINPADVYCPILKYLAFNNFDIDMMNEEDVPNYWEQAMLISKNPNVAAKFFNVFMKTFIKKLLKFNSCADERVDGILGRVKGYYGCVEAQGRGSLHCHMLIWVEGTLNLNDLKERVLNDNDFQQTLIAYLEDTISTSIPPLPDCEVFVPSDKIDAVSI